MDRSSFGATTFSRYVMFQWGHFFSEMDRSSFGATTFARYVMFQWGHFFSEMDRSQGPLLIIGAGLFQWGHFFSEMDRVSRNSVAVAVPSVSMGPLLFRNG